MHNHHTKHTPELIRAALAHIPANLPRDEWARVAMSIKSEYPDDTGRGLFEGWSAGADGYDKQACASTWRRQLRVQRPKPRRGANWFLILAKVSPSPFWLSNVSQRAPM